MIGSGGHPVLAMEFGRGERFDGYLKCFTSTREAQATNMC